ncbi:energy transducer TonB [Geitlerinema sp. PCC 9228]|uniref:energy transducer TonB n=1 Tax=Geitlerinema sp. PCC 9228 TaxID=111611 RepID=UPI000A00EDA2|nr:energy transducer TonB [Geitlerinema sp. PCC 9228]
MNQASSYNPSNSQIRYVIPSKPNRQSTWLAVVLSVGMHGLFFATILPNLEFADSEEASLEPPPSVDMVELSPQQQQRLPDFSANLPDFSSSPTPQTSGSSRLFPPLPPLPSPDTSPLPQTEYTPPQTFNYATGNNNRSTPVPQPTQVPAPSATSDTSTSGETEVSPTPEATQEGSSPPPSPVFTSPAHKIAAGPMPPDTLASPPPATPESSPSPAASAGSSQSPTPSILNEDLNAEDISPERREQLQALLEDARQERLGEQRSQSTAQRGEAMADSLEAYLDWMESLRSNYPQVEDTSAKTVTDFYPAAACESQLQGKAVVGVLVGSGGEFLEGPVLLNSSESDILDRAAVNYVKEQNFSSPDAPQAYWVAFDFQYAEKQCTEIN